MCVIYTIRWVFTGGGVYVCKISVYTKKLDCVIGLYDMPLDYL